MPNTRLAPLGAAALLLALAAAGAHAQTGRVCPNPSRPCAGFKAHDLSFVLPTGGVARAQATSQPFYAVILRSGRRCSIGEPARLQAQALFPYKAFVQRFECDDDVENNVYYTNANRSVAMLAVYAGSSRSEAAAMLARVQRTGRYPGANLRRMEVVFVYP
jgi:hypothetical protein